jgi:hypothetical protein
VTEEAPRDNGVAAVYIEGDSEAEVFNRAAQWIAKNDGSVEIHAVQWRRLSHQRITGQSVFEMDIYFEPQ